MKTVDLCLKNGKIVMEGSLIEAGVAIDGGKIESVSKDPSLPKSDETIDLHGSLLLPGVVDPHVHFREPGLTEKEDFFTGSSAAVAGGVTSVCDMPNTSPPTDSKKRLEEKKRLGENKSLVDFGLHGMLSGPIEKMNSLLEAGAVSLKLYPDKTEDSRIKEFHGKGDLITVHPEDPKMLKEDVEYNGFEAFLSSRPRTAEVSEVKRVLRYASAPHIHLCHVTTEESLRALKSKRNDRNFTCEVTPHHLLLDRSHMEEFGTIAKVNPPLREKRDREALLSGIEKGSVDIIATDHAPHTEQEKKSGMTNAPPGIVGVETSLTLMYNLFRRENIPLSRLVEAMCAKPAKIFGLKNESGIPKGVIREGADADLVAFNQDRDWEIKGEDLHGKTKFTPFEGREVLGKPFLTLVRGEIVFKKDEIVGDEGHGKFLSR